MMTKSTLLAWTQSLATGWGRLIHWGGRLAPFVCIVATGGRCGVLGLLAGWGVWFASTGRRLVIGAVIITLGLALATAWLVMVRPTAIENVRYFQDARLVHWRVSYEIINDRPLLGVGGSKDFKRENNRVVAAIYRDNPTKQYVDAPDAHNSFLGIACEYVIPALIF